MRGEQWACNRPGLQSVAALPSCSSGSQLGCHVDLSCLDDRECLHKVDEKAALLDFSLGEISSPYVCSKPILLVITVQEK